MQEITLSDRKQNPEVLQMQ